jgi:transposase
MQQRFIDLHPKTRNKIHSLVLESAQDGAYRVANRFKAILLNSDGKTSGEIANVLNVSRVITSKWLRTYEQQGIDGLLEGARSGRPGKLSEVQKIILCDIIDSGPVAYGYSTGVWTSAVIADVIETEFEISYHPGHVRKLLTEFGFSVQSPKRLLAAADKEKRDKWTSRSYLDLKKTLAPADVV